MTVNPLCRAGLPVDANLLIGMVSMLRQFEPGEIVEEHDRNLKCLLDAAAEDKLMWTCIKRQEATDFEAHKLHFPKLTCKSRKSNTFAT